jgi:hypothetical protein
MADFLSEAWLQEHPSADVPEVSAVVQHVVSGGPDGNVNYTVTYKKGTPTIAPGKCAGDPDVTLTLSYDDAQSLADGDMTLPIAFMRGNLKAEGAMPTIMALLHANR